MEPWKVIHLLSSIILKLSLDLVKEASQVQLMEDHKEISPIRMMMINFTLNKMKVMHQNRKKVRVTTRNKELQENLRRQPRAKVDISRLKKL